MKRYKVVLGEFISARDIEDMFRDLAKKDEVIIFDFGKSRSISFMHFLNFFLSSAFEMALEFAPINSTLYFFEKC